MRRFCVLLWLSAAAALAHPMGNFSVSHYARLEPGPQGVDLVYALDLAEIPTFDLLRSWNLERDSPREQLEARARAQARLWLSQLRITSNSRPVRAEFLSSELAIADGAGNLPIARITAHARVNASGAITYEDPNFAERSGWKEIVILAGRGTSLVQASQSGNDISKALTAYPPDPTLAPPQDLRAELAWRMETPAVSKRTAPKPVVIAPIQQPKTTAATPSPALRTAAAAPPGAVVRGDFLSKLLHHREITPWMMLLGLAAAFLLGGAHALTPGHGKTIVAAYLVGSRGTLKHAAFLGAMVTFTHTISVFLLGLATLFLFRFVVPEKITEWLGVVSGLSIDAVGFWMACKRWRASSRHAHHQHHHDEHPHHDLGHSHAHTHDGHDHHHHHGPGGHSHIPEELSWAGLVALGASGGLVPCESALVLLLGAIALGRAGLGLLLLVSFSAGLALVLIAIGSIVLYARHLLPDRKRASSGWFLRYVPVASAAVVTVIGMITTGIALGWIKPGWAAG